MKKQSLLQQIYQKYEEKTDFTKKTKDEIIELIIKEKDRIDRSDLEEILDDVYYKEYEKAEEEYQKSTRGSVKELKKLIKAFESGKTSDEKYEAMKEIVTYLKEKDLLRCSDLVAALLPVAFYALDIRDLEASAIILKTRWSIHQECVWTHTANGIDRMDIYDKFIDLIAEKCDEEEAEEYIKHMDEYVERTRISNAGRYVIYDEDAFRFDYKKLRAKYEDQV